MLNNSVRRSFQAGNSNFNWARLYCVLQQPAADTGQLSGLLQLQSAEQSRCHTHLSPHSLTQLHSSPAHAPTANHQSVLCLQAVPPQAQKEPKCLPVHHGLMAATRAPLYMPYSTLHHTASIAAFVHTHKHVLMSISSASLRRLLA